jgi:hypothetical protein
VTQQFGGAIDINHLVLSDGSILRLDFECERWHARWFEAGERHHLWCHAVGPWAQMVTVVNGWHTAFLASFASPVPEAGVDRSGVPSLAPTRAENQLGETA